MEKSLHHIDDYLTGEHIQVCEEDMKTELDAAGVDYAIRYIPVALIETTEREYTVAKTINVKNLLRMISESTSETIMNDELPVHVEINRD